MLNIGQRCTFILVHTVWVCVSLCTYIADVHLFPILKRKIERSETASVEDASWAQRELRAGARLHVFWCIRRRVRMCQRVCLLPCPASVKAVYIGPDMEDRISTLNNGLDIHYMHHRVPPSLKDPAVAPWDFRYCRFRLFQFQHEPNFIWSRAVENCQPRVQTQKHVRPRAPDAEACARCLSTLLQRVRINLELKQ